METQLTNLSPTLLEMETKVSQMGKEMDTEIISLKKEKSIIPEETTLMEDNINIDKQIPVVTMAEPIQEFSEKGEPYFLKKLRKILEDPETINIISWNVTKDSVMIWNCHEFCTKVLPRFYRHNNLSSFIRQLNHYGFKKMNRGDKDPSEYQHKDFQGGKEDLWNSSKNKCKKEGSSNPRFNLNQSCLEAKLKQLKDETDKINKQIKENNSNPNIDMDPSGLQAEIEKLKSYTNTMKVEIMELKVQQESITSHLVNIKKKVETNNEHNKEQIHTLFEKAIANPVFCNKFAQLMKEEMESKSSQIAKKQRTEGPQSSKSLEIFEGLENGENGNVEMITVEDEEPISGPVEHKAEEAVELGNWDLISRDSFFWSTVLVEDMNGEVKAQAEAEMENYWREKKIFVE